MFNEFNDKGEREVKLVCVWLFVFWGSAANFQIGTINCNFSLFISLSFARSKSILIVCQLRVQSFAWFSLSFSSLFWYTHTQFYYLTEQIGSRSTWNWLSTDKIMPFDVIVYSVFGQWPGPEHSFIYFLWRSIIMTSVGETTEAIDDFNIFQFILTVGRFHRRFSFYFTRIISTKKKRRVKLVELNKTED